MANCKCNCGSNDCVKLVYTCSGAANTGFLADQIARKIMKEGLGDMSCLSGIGADLSGFIESAKSATKNIIIDGCPVSCGKKIFEKYKLPYEQYIMTDFGVQKGKTEINEEIINKVFESIKSKI